MSTLNETITAFWPILVAILGLFVAVIVAWVNQKRDIKDTNHDISELGKRLDNENILFDKRMTTLETKVEAINPLLIDIQKQLVALTTKVDIYFKDKNI